MDIDSLNSLNPIDFVEDIIHSKKWPFSRAADDELVADISSLWCQYRLYFSWSERISAINFTVTFDLKFSYSNFRAIHELLALINEKLWIGHFDVTSKNGIPAFRHTLLVPQRTNPTVTDIWIHPHEMPTGDYFRGGWIRTVISNARWEVEKKKSPLVIKKKSKHLKK